MKRLRLILAFVLLCTNVCIAGYCGTLISEGNDLLNFRVISNIDDNTGHPFPYSIVKKPQVQQDGHTLYLNEGCDNTTIELTDENGQIVYTTDVAEGTEALTLPTSFSGTFELYIIRDRFTFEAEIEL